MIIVGLTGGIGSGKSFVSKIFKVLGVPVYHADKQSKTLVNTNKQLQKDIKEAFGPDIFTSDSINKEQFAHIIFSDKPTLQKANAIIHPYVKEDFKNWISRLQAGSSSLYCIIEAAILFESGFDSDVDIVISVSAPESLRIKRIMQRDGVSNADVRKRIQFQMPDEEKKSRSDFVINNNETDLLVPQIIDIHEKIQRIK